jgi:acetyl-CoA carboxylase biotin carboxyl carrier protein
MSDTHIDPDAIKALLEAFEASDWEQMTVTIGGDSLQVSRSGALIDKPTPPPTATPPPPSVPTPAATNGDVAAPAPQPPAPSPEVAAPPAASGTDGAAADSPDGVAVESPTVGIFWAAPAPDAPPFVEVGAKVGAEDTIAIVEVMKLMNHVPAGVAGTVTAVLVENGQAVEFGESLILVDPDAA